MEIQLINLSLFMMKYLTHFFILLFGLAVGSFLNVIIYWAKEEKRKSILGHSFCPDCGHKLVWYDLFPVFSFLALKGKCRYCHKKISFQYPIIEFLTAGMFVLVATETGYARTINNFLFSFGKLNFELLAVDVIKLFLIFILFSIFIVIAVYDFQTQFVLSSFIYYAIAISVIYHLLNFRGNFFSIELLDFFKTYALAFLYTVLLLFPLSYFSKEKLLGAGDVEIGALIAVLLGHPLTIVALYIAFISGSIYGLTLLLLKKAEMKTAISFGPFMISGLVIAFLYGQQILDIYGRMFI